jgi:hypothetical protein
MSKWVDGWKSLKPFSGAPGVPDWVVEMGNTMRPEDTDLTSGQWLVRREELGVRKEYWLLVATSR